MDHPIHHILPLILILCNTKRLLLCTSHDVNFDFFYIPPPLGYLRWWRHRYHLREFNGKYRISMGKKLALITNGLSGYPKTRPDSDPMTRLASNFSAAPRGDPIICNRAQPYRQQDRCSLFVVAPGLCHLNCYIGIPLKILHFNVKKVGTGVAPSTDKPH